MTDANRRRLRLRHIRKLIQSGVRLNRAYREEENSDSSSVVLLNNRSMSIAQRAEVLADDEREDEDAVSELRSLAGRHKNDLRVAALFFQQDHRDRELRVANRAWRLVKAAIADSAVPAPSVEDVQRFEILERFQALDLNAKWQELTLKEPRLSALAGSEVAAQARRLPNLFEIRALPEVGPDVRNELLRHYGELINRLEEAVGPRSTHTDLLLQSKMAYDAAWEKITHG